MGDNETQAAGGNDQQEMNAFTGGSFVDGVRQEPDKGAATQAAGKAEDTTKGGAGEDTTKGGAGKDDTKDDKHRDAQARIDKAVGKQRAAERRAEAAEAANRTLEQRLANIEARLSGGGQGGKAADKSDAEPDAKDYQGGEFDPRYIRDLARYEARKAATETSRKSQESASSREAAAAAEETQRQIEEFADKASEVYDDFREVVFDDSNKFSPTLVALTIESEFGAQIAYELASDPKEQRRIANLPAAAQAKWFGKREAELESSSKAKDANEGDGAGAGADASSKPKPKAPPPPQHQGKGNGGTGQVSAATTDFAAFERMATGGRK